MQDINFIKKTNKMRMDILKAPYDPFWGIGSPIDRKALFLNNKKAFYLPYEMFDEPFIKEVSEYKNIQEYVNANFENKDKGFNLTLNKIEAIRRKYDFEYWCFMYHLIRDAETAELVNFKLRLPQRKVWKAVHKLIKANKPIRIIIGKARQWGGSTFANALHRWIQVEIKTNWDSAICGDVEDQAKTIRGMSDELYANYPHGKLSLLPFKGSSKNKIIKERGCLVAVGSMEKPDNLRGNSFKMLHLTEVGIWKKTQNRSPKSLAQSLRGQVKKLPLTVIIMESTAKGVGNFFHEEWKAARKAEKDGKNGYIPIFVAWFEIDLYLKPIDDYDKFIEWMFTNEYAMFLWELGATLEGINWYFDYKSSENMDDFSMNSEFPSTEDEMFSSSGRRAFKPLYVKYARRNNINPVLVGDIFADAISGKESLNNISIQKHVNGQLKVWVLPDKTEIIKNRYVVPVDIGGRTKKADYSVIRVIDRYPLLFGGAPEAILTWKGHLDQDLVIWKAVQIAKFYNDALLVPEQNSLRKDQQDSEGDHFLTLLDEIIDIYDNIFCRTSPEQIKQGAPKRYGFHTGSNKADLITNVNKKLRDEGYIEYDSEVCDEYDYYEIKDDGTYGNVDGQHDDLVMCTAIGLKASDLMDMPIIITEEHKYIPSKQIISEATF